MKRQILFVAYYYAILLCAYVFVFQVLTGVLKLYSLAYHLLIFLLFMLVHMSVFLMQCSCQPKFHVRDNKVLTYLLTYLLYKDTLAEWQRHFRALWSACFRLPFLFYKLTQYYKESNHHKETSAENKV